MWGCKMFITTRQLNAASSGMKIAADYKDTTEDKVFYQTIQEALIAAIDICLKRKVGGLEVPELKTAEFIIKIAAIYEELKIVSLKRRR